jgi:beta-lactamase class A
MDYQHYTPLKIKRRGKANRPKVFILALFIIGAYILFNQLKPTPNTNISPNTTAKVLSESTSKQPSQLKDIVLQTIKNSKGEYAVAIIHLQSGETFLFNQGQSFNSFSLYKLWTMATVFEQIEAGKLQKDQVLKEEVPILNEKFQIATEEAELKEGTVELSVENALYQMITISDNYSALLLSWNVGLANIQEFLKEYSFSHSSVGISGGFPQTTALDIALFFEKLYNLELVSPQSSKEMLSLLKQQRLNQKIPKYLPKNTLVAHKTGEFGEYSHDAGIVYSPYGNYILVVLSKNSNQAEASEQIAVLSKKIFDYFNTK